MRRNGFLFAVKLAVLALIDAGTITVLAFPRSILAEGLFPWLIANILLVLFLIDLLILALPVFCTLLRVNSAAPPVLIAFLYYIFTLTFTYLTRSWIEPIWYGIGSLLALFVYCLCIISLRLASGGRSQKRGPQVRMEDMQLLILQMQTCLHQLQPLLETREYESLRKSLDSLRERLEFNAPFGRSDQPVVLDIERQIYLRADKLYRHMQLLTSKSEQTKDASELVGEALAMLELVKSREKLNIR